MKPNPPPSANPPAPAGKNGPAADLDLPRLQRLCLNEVRKLKEDFEEAAEKYLFRVRGRLEHIVKFMSQESLQDAFFKKTPEQIKQDLRFMLSQLKAVRVKPGKGRRKDLKRIENLLKSLLWVQEVDKPLMLKKPPKPKPPRPPHDRDQPGKRD